MAAVTFTVGTKTFSTTITAGNATRAAAWAAAQYPTIPNPSFNPAIPEHPVSNPRTLPNPEPVISALAAMYQGMKDNVRRWEQDQSKSAVALPGDLT